MQNALIFALALGLALIATPLAARAARRLHIVDRPGALKVQQEPVPYLGGVAVMLALGLAALAGGMPFAWVIPMLLALALGVVDDIAGVQPRFRLCAQAVIGVLAGLIVPARGPFGVLVTASAAVVLMNAVNLLDGLDGLAAGVALASALGFAVIGGAGGSLALALAGATLGFLAYNRPPARIYLGDGGSYMLGIVMAILAASALHHEDEAVYWILVPLLVALPLLDTSVAIIRRARAHAPIFGGDRNHIYDQLVDRGLSRSSAVLVCIAAQLVVVIAAVLAWTLPDPAAAAIGLAIVGLLIAGAAIFSSLSADPLERSS
jgi:UDP-GlcNAc:undecaprenyl-phosphate GlcNAc-1-phosphate transferase